MLLYVGTVVYFFIAKLLFKRPTHGEDILLLKEEGGTGAESED